MRRTGILQPLLLLSASLGLAACSGNLQPIALDLAPPEQWASPASPQTVDDGWLGELNDPALAQAVAHAVQNNPALAAGRLRLQQAEQQLRISGSERYPALDLGLAANRNRSAGGSLDSSASLEAQLNWELDLWGRLSDSERQARLTLATRRAELEDQTQQLATDAANGWYALQEAQLLLALYSQRRQNLQQNLKLIESRYRQGLNSALDVYLARNDLRAEEARVSRQQQTWQESQRNLERLLGDYPAARLSASGTLPLIDQAIPAGLPADLVRRRPDLRSRWLELLAADAALAVAHKDRFPRLSLTGSLGSRSDALADLVSGGRLLWSLAASLSQSLFDAGRRSATEALRLAQRQELEQLYVDRIFDAFSEVENLLSNQQALQQQHAYYLEARSNAEAARSLAFEQYQKGLVNYTTVLESQRRAFDAQTTVIQLRRQLLSNRINLYRALGGSFHPPGPTVPAPEIEP